MHICYNLVMKNLLIITMLQMISANLFANDIIIQLKQPIIGADKSTFKTLGLDFKSHLIPDLNIYLFKSLKADKDESFIKNLLATNSKVKTALFDEIVQLRELTPNDQHFSEQWALFNKANPATDIDAKKAWDYGTGGKTFSGDDIVVAVVDAGVDIGHKDLVKNIWVNESEIPGNGVDDDQNGYIDDIHGWNAFKNSGKNKKSAHGTHVAGIIGAEGNNKNQITGVNWNVKIMDIAAATARTSVVMIGYNYILTQKKLWLNSNGRIGANIVATNSSFGVNQAKCKGKYQIWNDIYEQMGFYGILSVVATANKKWDIDSVGDVPSGCSSDFIIAVTNSNQKDEMNRTAGFGTKTIDLAAPGTRIFSTVTNNRLGNKSGTSMATPIVTGAIALLYSLGGKEFDTLRQADPAKAALKIKEVILNNVDKIKAFQGKTVSGGRLNLGRAAQALIAK